LGDRHRHLAGAGYLAGAVLELPWF
jgi:hypothetical protein